MIILLPSFGVILNQMKNKLVSAGLALALSMGLAKGAELSVRLAKAALLSDDGGEGAWSGASWGPAVFG